MWQPILVTKYLNSICLLFFISLLVGCASSPEPSKKYRPYSPFYSSRSKSSLVNYALSLQGTPYRYGKASPQEGFDCSGFVQHVFKYHGIRLPRTANDMAVSLTSISKYDLTPGDLVFFDTNGRTYSHVGIVVNNSQFVHSSSSHSGGVMVSSLDKQYWRQHFTGARRVR